MVLCWEAHICTIGKLFFHRHENKYHLFKNGVEYIVRAHTKKMNLSLVNVGQMKKLVNASKNFCSLND
jgi:hypothetical protein